MRVKRDSLVFLAQPSACRTPTQMGTSRNEHLSLHFKLAVVYKWYRCLRLMPHLVNRPLSSRLVPHQCGTITFTRSLLQSCSSWHGSDLRRALGSVCINYGEALHVPMPQFSLFKNRHLALYRHSENHFRAGKVAPNTWKFRHINIFQFYTFMQSWAITSPAFKGSNERCTQKRTEFPFHVHQHYSSYTGQMLKRSHSVSQPCPGLFHSDL